MGFGAFFVMGDIKGGKRFKDNLAAVIEHKNVSHPNVLYLGIACDNDLSQKASFERGLMSSVPQANFQSLNLSEHIAWNAKHADPAYIQRSFRKADIIFFDGGELQSLRATFDRFALRQTIKDAYHNGAYIGGLCGGGSFLAQHVVFCEQAIIQCQQGAGFIENTVISCHMDIPEQLERRTFFMRDILTTGAATTAYGLSSNQMIFFKEGKAGLLKKLDDEALAPLQMTAAHSDRLVFMHS